jgi:hypothetical protein
MTALTVRLLVNLDTPILSKLMLIIALGASSFQRLVPR